MQGLRAEDRSLADAVRQTSIGRVRPKLINAGTTMRAGESSKLGSAARLCAGAASGSRQQPVAEIVPNTQPAFV
jgi:hypothetical protein